VSQQYYCRVELLLGLHRNALCESAACFSWTDKHQPADSNPRKTNLLWENAAVRLALPIPCSISERITAPLAGAGMICGVLPDEVFGSP